MVNGIDKLIPIMREYHKEILNDPENNSDEGGLLIALDSYKNHLVSQQKGLTLGLQVTAVSDTNWNYIYSQKISTKTGVMYLLARLLCVTLQVIMYDAYQKSRMKFIKIIYEIIKYFFTQEYLINGEFIHDIEPQEIYKKTKDMDIRNKNQRYTLTFHHLFFRNDPKIFNDPIGIEWRNCEHSTFQLFEEFMSHQPQYPHIKNTMFYRVL